MPYRVWLLRRDHRELTCWAFLALLMTSAHRIDIVALALSDLPHCCPWPRRDVFIKRDDYVIKPTFLEDGKRRFEPKFTIGKSKPASDQVDRKTTSLKNMNGQNSELSDSLLVIASGSLAAEPATNRTLIGTNTFRQIPGIETDGLKGGEDVVWP